MTDPTTSANKTRTLRPDWKTYYFVVAASILGLLAIVFGLFGPHSPLHAEHTVRPANITKECWNQIQQKPFDMPACAWH